MISPPADGARREDEVVVFSVFGVGALVVAFSHCSDVDERIADV